MKELRLFPNPMMSPIILLPLLAFLFVRGIIPAFTEIDTDFPNYYTAGLIASKGEETSRLYNDHWFQDQIHAAGIQHEGKFSPFPPETALPFIPLSAFSPIVALRIVTCFNLALLVCSVWLIADIFKMKLIDAVVFVLLAGTGLANCFRFGQMYLGVSVSMLSSYYFYRKLKPVMAGVFAGSFIPIKYFPVLLLILFAIKRDWKPLFFALLTALSITVVGVATLGWDIHKQFLSSVLGNHLSGQFGDQNPFSQAFQSWNSVALRLFVRNPEHNPAPLLDSPLMVSVTKGVVFAGTIACLAYSWVTLSKKARGEREQTIFALVCIAGLLLAPGTATYHFVLLWLPICILLTMLRTTNNVMAFTTVLVCYALIGFIPYSILARFDRGGLQALLGYPRLWLLSALFVTSAVAAWRHWDTRSTTPVVSP